MATFEQTIPEYPCDQRVCATSVTVPNGTDTSAAVQLSAFRSGLVKCPAGVVGPLTFTASPTRDGTYTAINAVSLTISAATEWEELPDAVMKAGWIKMVNGAGNVTGDQTVVLLLKT